MIFRFFASFLWVGPIVFALGAPSHGASISVTLNNDQTTCVTNGVACIGAASGGDAFGWAQFRAGGTSETLLGSGSTSASFVAVAAVAADDSGSDLAGSDDRRITLALDYTLNIFIDVDGVADTWRVDLLQNAQGLFAFQGEPGAIGDQEDGQASLSTLAVIVNGSHFDFTTTPSLVDQDCSLSCRTSTLFSGARNDVGVLSGAGDAYFTATVRVELSALSNDGCTGAGCASFSGGEEAAVLFGVSGVLSSETVDDYATWGRPINSGDGYRSTWTLNVTVPEPRAIAVPALTLALAISRRKRRRRG